VSCADWPYHGVNQGHPEFSQEAMMAVAAMRQEAMMAVAAMRRSGIRHQAA
jgi:hypothetical protein